MLFVKQIQVIILSEPHHYLGFLAANLLLNEVRHVYHIWVFGVVRKCLDLLTDVLEHIIVIDQLKGICTLIIGILLQEVVVYILDVVVGVRVFQILVKLILNNPYNGIPTLLLDINFLGCTLHTPILPRIQSIFIQLKLDLVLG